MPAMRRTIRRQSARWAVAVVSANLVWLASGVQAAPLAAASSPARGAATLAAVGSGGAASSGTGASDVANLGSDGWKVQSSAVATESGAQISTPRFETKTWLPVSNDDAGAPGTEIQALAQNGRCPGDTALELVDQSSGGPPSVFFSTNIQSTYGFMIKLGQVTVKQFIVPWWWRTDFMPNLQAGQMATLIVNGVVGSANVWVNGHQVADSSTVTGAYTRFTFDLTNLIVAGPNSLAIEVSPN